jgi:hypothetical protein
MAGRSDEKFWRYVGKVDNIVEVLWLFHVRSNALWCVWAVSFSNSRESCWHSGSDHMAFLVYGKRACFSLQCGPRSNVVTGTRVPSCRMCSHAETSARNTKKDLRKPLNFKRYAVQLFEAVEDGDKEKNI